MIAQIEIAPRVSLARRILTPSLDTMLAVAISAAAPSLAAIYFPGHTLLEINSAAMMLFALLKVPCILAGILSTAKDGEPIMNGSVWSPMAMALTVGMMVPVGLTGASTVQLIANSLF